VLLYVKKVLKPIEFVTSSTFVDHILCKVSNLLTGVCYQSSNYTIVGHDSNDSLNQLIKDINDKHFLMMGDFNYPDINWLQLTVDDSASTDCKELFHCFNECFLTQHVTEYTRGNAVLDLVFSREPELVSNVKTVENLGTSDHNMVSFSIHDEQNNFVTDS